MNETLAGNNGAAADPYANNPDPDLHPRLIQAQKDSINSTLEGLHEQVDRYKDLRNGRLQRLKLESIEDVGRALIEARIAERLIHKELAARSGLFSYCPCENVDTTFHFYNT